MSLTLAQLRQLKKVKLENADLPILLLFESLSPMHSILLEQLLFRLQNHTQPVHVIFANSDTVTVRDTQVGTFLAEDVGRQRGVVLRDRYSGFFPNVRLHMCHSSQDVHRILQSDQAKIPIIFSNGYSSYIERLKNMNEQNALWIKHTNGAEHKQRIELKIIRSNMIFGGVENELPPPPNRVQFAKQYTENTLVAQRIFNIINEYVAGNHFTLRALEGSILTENLKPTYFIGRLWEGFVGKYEVLFRNLHFDQHVLREVGEWFDTFHDVAENNQELNRIAANYTNRHKALIKAQMGYLIQGLTIYKDTLQSQDNLDLRKRVQVIIGLLLKLNSGDAEAHFGDAYIHTLLGFIQFIKKQVHYENLFE